MMFGFGFLMMLGFLCIPLALIGVGIVVVALVLKRQDRTQ